MKFFSFQKASFLAVFLLTFSFHAATAGIQDYSRKISPILKKFVVNLNANGVKAGQKSPRPLSSYSTRQVRIQDDGRVKVMVRLTEVNEANLALLTAKGLIVRTSLPKYRIVEGTVPYNQINNLAALDCVVSVYVPLPPVLRRGSVTTEGDAILRSDDVRSSLGYTGNGIKVGVISDGVAGLFTSVDSNDLPDGSDTTCDPMGASASGVHCNAFNAFGIDFGSEGTAMLEIIHDMAPDADLTFVNTDDSAASMVEAINYLAQTAQVDVIVDDLGFFEEPSFEDGMVADAAQAAVDSGIVYVSAGGNDAPGHLQEAFTDSDADGFHNFQGIDAAPNSYPITIPNGYDLDFILQWDDPFSGVTHPVNFTLDVYSDEARTNPLSSEAGLENEPGTPWLEITYLNASEDTLYGSLTIEATGDAPGNWEMFIPNSYLYLVDDLGGPYFTAGDSVFGHPAAVGALAIAAISADDPDHDTIEDFSSQGPTTITGEAQREKPDFSAVDNVSVTGNGGFPTTFIGTSAAAPHAAACIALMLQADPSLTPARVKTILTSSGVDKGSAGLDQVFGNGLIESLTAVQTIDPVGIGGTGDGGTSSSGCSLLPESPGLKTDTRGLTGFLILMMILQAPFIARRFGHLL